MLFIKTKSCKRQQQYHHKSEYLDSKYMFRWKCHNQKAGCQETFYGAHYIQNQLWQNTIEELENNPSKLPEAFIESSESKTCLIQNNITISDPFRQVKLLASTFEANFTP